MSVAVHSVLLLDDCCRPLTRAPSEGASSPKKTLPGSWHALMLCKKSNHLSSSALVICLHVASILWNVPASKIYSLLCHMMSQICTYAWCTANGIVSTHCCISGNTCMVKQLASVSEPRSYLLVFRCLQLLKGGYGASRGLQGALLQRRCCFLVSTSSWLVSNLAEHAVLALQSVIVYLAAALR